MKTPEQALTEWVADDIIFNYIDGRGKIHHNRDQFVKVCNVFRSGNENAAPEDTTAPLGVVSGSHFSSNSMFARPVSGITMNSSGERWEAKRADISNVLGWAAVHSVHAATATFRALLQKKLGEVEPWVESQIRGFCDPRKVAQFETVRELIQHILQIGQSITIKGQ